MIQLINCLNFTSVSLLLLFTAMNTSNKLKHCQLRSKLDIDAQ